MNRYLAAGLATALLACTATAQTPPTKKKQFAPATNLINDVEQSVIATHEATPFLERTTFGLLDVDISKLDVDATWKWITGSAGPGGANNQQQAVLTMVRGFTDSLKAAGVEHIYVTGSTRSVTDGGPLVIVPCKNTAVVKGLAAALLNGASKEPPKKVHIGDQLVLGGAAAVVDRVSSGEGTLRGDLIMPLKDDSRLDHSIVISLPNEARAELAALWPNRLPEESPIQFSPRRMVADIQRVFISFDLPPQPQVHARIETRDAGAAARVKKTVDEMLALVPQAKQAVNVKVEISNVLLDAAPEELVKLVVEVAKPMRKSAEQAQRLNSLKQLALAMHNYHDVNKHLPPRCLTDRDGNPLHSWRTVVLPYVEQQALHKRIDLSQSWDSEQNRLVTQTIIPLFSGGQESTKTRFRVPVFPGSLWHGEGPPKEFKNVIDGTSNTIAAIFAPADAAVDWADPQPWVLSEDDPMSSVFGDRDIVEVMMMDGSARVFQRGELNNKKLKALLTYAGRESID